MVGVAYRGKIPLENIEVDFEVEPLERPQTIGFGVKKSIILQGNITDSEKVRLERAAAYCPVGQALTKGSIKIEDEIRWESGDVAVVPLTSEIDQSLYTRLATVPSGSVHGRYLIDTKEYNGEGEMEHEGEVEVYVASNNLTRSSRWSFLAGHSSNGWVPPPFPFAQAAWTASTAATLDTLLPQSQATVGLVMDPAGGRGQSQGNAADGKIGERSIRRIVGIAGSPQTNPVEAIGAALQMDPITAAYRGAGIVLDEITTIENI